MHQLRVFHDFCAETPLWGLGDGPVPYAALNLSEGLSRELDAWTLFWNENCTPDGWRSTDAYREYCETGRDLIRKLRSELPGWVVSTDPELSE
ncbi:hypothetical protein [Gulosibacter bifidus]|uniref:Uncharacterized protein n=1 Tax=Gulosibacter bifidus TaxID=272239 RepID=A0ABW5RIY8_9MICO|nr:hypothetical protein [Gulosibacter bifidus]